MSFHEFSKQTNEVIKNSLWFLLKPSSLSLMGKYSTQLKKLNLLLQTIQNILKMSELWQDY